MMARPTFGEKGHTTLEFLPKLKPVRFRDLICLRAGVDDDEQNQPDFEMTVEMWERASWDEYETSTLSKTRDHRIEVWTDGSAKEKDSPWAHARAGVTWGSEHLQRFLSLSHAGTHSRMIERNWKRCCVQC